MKTPQKNYVKKFEIIRFIFEGQKYVNILISFSRIEFYCVTKTCPVIDMKTP